MSEQKALEKQKSRTAIIVALITAFGGLGAAVIANWDKVRPVPQERTREAARGAVETGATPDGSQNVDSKEPIIASSSDPRSTTHRQEHLGYEFELLGCEKTGRSTACRLLVRNLREDRNLHLVKKGTGRRIGETRGIKGARIFDSNGSEIFASSIRLASVTSETEADVGPQALLIGNLETPLRLRFDGTDPNASQIPRLFINGWDLAAKAKVEIAFEDIHLSGST